MTVSHLIYPTSNGFIHHWLVSGPLTVPLPGSRAASRQDWADEVLTRVHQPDTGVSEPVVDRGRLSTSPNLASQTWQYYRCQEDHFIDFSAFYPTCAYLRAWAFTQVIIPAGDQALAEKSVADIRPVRFLMTTDGAAEVWVNGQPIHRQITRQPQPQTTEIPVTLKTGSNDILIHLEQAALRDTPLHLALQLRATHAASSQPAEIEIAIPTLIEPESLAKRQLLETLAEKAYLDRYVYGYLQGDKYNRNEAIPLHFASDLTVSGTLTYRLQSLAGDIFQEGTKEFSAGSQTEMAKIFPLRNGPHHLALLPPANEYYLKHLCFERKSLFYVVRTAFATQPNGDFASRANEALADAASRRNESLYCELAKLARKDWERFDWKIANRALERISQKHDGSIYDLLGFIGMLQRYGKRKQFFKTFRPALESAILGYPFCAAGPGEVNARTVAAVEAAFAMDCDSESRQIACLAGEILAGQLFPERLFEQSGRTGGWHQAHGEAQAEAWLRLHGQFGFRDWDSPASMEAILTALSHLVDLAQSKTVREFAITLMDKIFFSLAVNSFQGAYGVCKGRADTASLLSSRLEPTSGISRLMWGCGNYNEHLMGIVSLATCKGYQLPETIAKIACDRPGVLWGLESHRLPAPTDSTQTGWEVNKVLYKTADFMLSSAQDYYPGKNGAAEHIWQATLSPDAIVYVNHPTCLSEEDTHQPNLWRGNGVLPRIAQWGDVLIAIYQLPHNDWLGFTHAYFPTAAFDETRLQDKWAFARKGNGYLALTAACGFEAITLGRTAYRELRSTGTQNIWLCHMGQALLDGSFENFQQKILAMPARFEPLAMQVDTLRGDALSFGWQSGLMVNGNDQPLAGFSHFENPYCKVDLPAQQMDILYQDEGIRLTFI